MIVPSTIARLVRRSQWCFILGILVLTSLSGVRAETRVGLAEEDLTPPTGFPMAGYYHERLAEGTIDPLKAKAIVFRGDDASAGIVICDLIGISADLSWEIRQRASKETGIPVEHLVVAATHSHTAPDYTKELVRYLDGMREDPSRSEYISKLISAPAQALINAYHAAQPAHLTAGHAIQNHPVAFNRRFVMRDGSVKTWMNHQNPDVIRAAGPIDPRIEILRIDSTDGKPRGVFTNFALHLDTVGGTRWSPDYPGHIERTLRQAKGDSLISLFGTGCCGDINHANPDGGPRNTAEMIGTSLGETILNGWDACASMDTAASTFRVASETVAIPLDSATEAEVTAAVAVLKRIQQGEKVEFLEHVNAYKKVMIDQLRRKQPLANTRELITWGLSRRWAGIGETLPMEVTVIRPAEDVAIVCLPGEVFVDLGLAIKRASPCRTTLVVELCNCVESIYVPHRAAYAGGSYEVTNSAVAPGSGEMLVESAVRLLKQVSTPASAPKP